MRKKVVVVEGNALMANPFCGLCVPSSPCDGLLRRIPRRQHLHTPTSCTAKLSWVLLRQLSYAFIPGTDVFLAGYPRLDSQEEEEDILVTYGPISRTALRADSPVALAQYPAFANSSGGAVVSSRGRLVGIHLESYHTEYHDYYRGPQSPFDDPEISDSCEVRSLQWEEFILHDDPDVKLAATDVKDLARHAVCNMGEKGMLGGFLPVNYLRLKLKNEGIISKQSTKTKRRRKV